MVAVQDVRPPRHRFEIIEHDDTLFVQGGSNRTGIRTVRGNLMSEGAQSQGHIPHPKLRARPDGKGVIREENLQWTHAARSAAARTIALSGATCLP